MNMAKTWSILNLPHPALIPSMLDRTLFDASV